MSQIQRSVELLAETLQGKNKAYSGNSGEFYNFQRAGEFSKVTPFEVILSQIAIKFTRIENLNINPESVAYESMRDSLLDLAGYALIAHAYLGQASRLTENYNAPTYQDWSSAG